MPLRADGAPFWRAAVTAAILAALPVTRADAAPDRLAGHRWKERVLLVVAPDADDARLRQQREIFRRMGSAAAERDLTLVEVVGDTAEAATVRQTFGLGTGFHALLIGKDGGAKLESTVPLQPEAMVPLIDSMPMRQQEMRQRS